MLVNNVKDSPRAAPDNDQVRGAQVNPVLGGERHAAGAVLVSSGLGDYGDHGSYLPDQRWRAGLA